MYLDALLEVIIGLVLTWLVLSIASMQIQEWISSIFHTRAKFLEETLQNMFSSKDLADEFYKHPGIASLYSSKNKPSYIHSERFSQTLNEVYIQQPDDVKRRLIFGKKLILEDVRGIGPVAAAILKSNEINTVEELAAMEEKTLRGYFEKIKYANLADEKAILQNANDLLNEKKQAQKKKVNRSQKAE